MRGPDFRFTRRVSWRPFWVTQRYRLVQASVHEFRVMHCACPEPSQRHAQHRHRDLRLARLAAAFAGAGLTFTIPESTPVHFPSAARFSLS
jgi:hypothetical protein